MTKKIYRVEDHTDSKKIKRLISYYDKKSAKETMAKLQKEHPDRKYCIFIYIQDDIKILTELKDINRIIW